MLPENVSLTTSIFRNEIIILDVNSSDKQHYYCAHSKINTHYRRTVCPQSLIIVKRKLILIICFFFLDVALFFLSIMINVLKNKK